MKLRIALIMLAGLASGCASTMNVSMMARDSGTSYTGEIKANGTGGGVMNISIGSDTCMGPVARVASNESLGFASMYGTSGRSAPSIVSGMSVTTGDTLVKAILSCSNGKGLRCELTGRDSHGGGICVDDAGKIFDVIAFRQ